MTDEWSFYQSKTFGLDDALDTVTRTPSKSGEFSKDNETASIMAKKGKPKRMFHYLSAVKANDKKLKLISGFGDSLKMMGKLRWLLVAILPLTLLNLTEAYLSIAKTQVLMNKVEVYQSVLEIYCLHAYLYSALVHMSVWPNEQRFMQEDVRKGFSARLAKFKNELVPRFVSLKQLDLGDFKESFDRLMLHPNFCELALEAGTSENGFAVIFGCGTGASVYLNDTIEMVLTKLSSLMDSFFTEMVGLMDSGEPAQRISSIMFALPKFKDFIVYSTDDGIMGNVYFLTMRELSIHLEDYLLKEDLSTASYGKVSAKMFSVLPQTQAFAAMTAVLVVAGMPLIYALFIRRLRRGFEVFNNTCMLVPISLTMNNPLLSHHFND